MTLEKAALLSETFLSAVRQESAITKRVLSAIPPDNCKYRPHPDSRSAFELAWHIASVDVWFLDGFLQGKFALEGDDSIPDDFQDSRDVVAWYEDNFPAKLDEVTKLSVDFWATPLEFFGIYNYPAVMYLQFMLFHTIHHRGQLTAYLRPMGAKVPNIYGGSFDEPMQPPPAK
ncbi:MAG TPA: DinB family protein [Candidatus Acidoferrum sp.]|nr:DinB family protein [Candidatus Acidoferrum sp.]